MEMTEKNKSSLSAMMETSMDKIRQMVDSNTIVGEPITTPDGVTLIPVSRLSYGFGCGGGDYGKNKENSGAGCGAGVRVEPMAFLVVKGGVTRMLPVGTPAITTVDRVIEMVPELLDRVELFVRLWNALNSLPEIQGRRIDAHIILGKSIKEIAEAEGVHEESVRQSIKRGLERMKKTF